MFANFVSKRVLSLAPFVVALGGFGAASSLTLTAQQPPASAPPALTAADYARAEKFMGYNTTPLVLHSDVHATWLPDDRFWYRMTTENGSEAVLVDPASATRSACDLPACKAASASEAAAAAARSAPLSYARCRPTASRRRSSATGTCGCATSPPARKRSSPPTA